MMLKSKKLNYSQLKNKILLLIDYVKNLIKENKVSNIVLLEDVILTEMYDLLFGIDSEKLIIPNTSLLLDSMYHVTDGSVEDPYLVSLITDVQKEVYQVKKIIDSPCKLTMYDHIASAILGLFILPSIVSFVYLFIEKKLIFIILFLFTFIVIIADIIYLFKISKKRNRYHYLFPNLTYSNCLYVVECEYKSEDILEVGFDNGYQIDLGYIEEDNKYVITIIKDENWNNIIEEIIVEKRYEVEKILINKILEFSNKS